MRLVSLGAGAVINYLQTFLELFNMFEQKIGQTSNSVNRKLDEPSGLVTVMRDAELFHWNELVKNKKMLDKNSKELEGLRSVNLKIKSKCAEASEAVEASEVVVEGELKEEVTENNKFYSFISSITPNAVASQNPKVSGVTAKLMFTLRNCYTEFLRFVESLYFFICVGEDPRIPLNKLILFTQQTGEAPAPH